MSFIQWFRDSSPYFEAHRHKTFVVHLAGESFLDEALLKSLASDIKLLYRLSIRLVLVLGSRPQISHALAQARLAEIFHLDRRVTTGDAVAVINPAILAQQLELMSLMAQGKPKTPLISGSFVTAKPLGVIQGIDYQQTGQVRSVDTASLQACLDARQIPLLTAGAFSLTGQWFNLSSEEIAVHVASGLKAEKLIFLAHPNDLPQIQARQLNPQQAQQALLTNPQKRLINRALTASLKGVARVHLLDVTQADSLLMELFTREGSGLLINADDYHTIRGAKLDDIAGILTLTEPLEQQGVLVARTREDLEINIADYTVIDRDGLIIGLAGLHIYGSQAELAALVIHPDYRQKSLGEQLMHALIQKANQLGVRQLFALSTQTRDWFIERGFREGPLEQLPPAKQAKMDPNRKSKVLYKDLRAVDVDSRD